MFDYAINYIYKSLEKDMWLKSGHKLTDEQSDMLIDYVIVTYSCFVDQICENKPISYECRESIKKFLDIFISTENIIYTTNSKELNLFLNSNDEYYITFESLRSTIHILNVLATNDNLQNELQIDNGLHTRKDAVDLIHTLVKYINHMSPECSEIARKHLPHMINQLSSCYKDKGKNKLEWFSEVTEKLNIARDNVYVYIYNVLLESNPDIDEIDIYNFTNEFFNINIDGFFNIFFLANTYDNIFDESINKLCEDIINIIMLMINSYNKLRSDYDS